MWKTILIILGRNLFFRNWNIKHPLQSLFYSPFIWTLSTLLTPCTPLVPTLYIPPLWFYLMCSGSSCSSTWQNRRWSLCCLGNFTGDNTRAINASTDLNKKARHGSREDTMLRFIEGLKRAEKSEGLKRWEIQGKAERGGGSWQEEKIAGRRLNVTSGTSDGQVG